MGKIDAGRVVVGGLFAGLIINVSESSLNLGVIAGESAATMETLGLPPLVGAAVAVFVAFGFLSGRLPSGSTLPSGRGSGRVPRRR